MTKTSRLRAAFLLPALLGTTALLSPVQAQETCVGDQCTPAGSLYRYITNLSISGQLTANRVLASGIQYTTAASTADLRSVTAPKSSVAVAERMGQATSGDGGQAYYLWTPGSSCTDDGGGCITPTGRVTNTGRWVLICPPAGLDTRVYPVIRDGASNDTAAFNNWLNKVMVCGAGHLAPGTYKVTSQPPAINKQVHLYGDGKLAATILGAYNRTGTTGVLALVNGSDGSSIERMSIQTAAGTTGGSVISIVDDGTVSPSAEGTHLKHLWLTTTGSDTHTNTIYLDGSARTSGAIGLRETMLEDVDIFGSNGCSLYVKSIVGLTMVGGSINGAGGTNTLSGSACIDGTVGVPSQYINLFPASLNGYLSLAHTTGGSLIVPSIGAVAGISITDDNTASNWMVRGFVAGTVQTAWLNSSYIGTDGTRRGTFTNGEYYVQPGGVVNYWQVVTATTTPQTLTFDASVGGFTAVPRCIAQMLDMPAASRETADLANITTTTVDYSTSSAVSRAMDISCIGVAAHGNVLPGYP